MDDLVQFLTARYDEAERAQDSLDDWHARDCESIPVAGYNGPFPCDCGVPQRVLADIGAKRRILDEHQDVNDGSCGTCVNGQWGYPTHGGSSPQDYPCRTLRLLAAPYAGHPDYDEDWRP